MTILSPLLLLPLSFNLSKQHLLLFHKLLLSQPQTGRFFLRPPPLRFIIPFNIHIRHLFLCLPHLCLIFGLVLRRESFRFAPLRFELLCLGLCLGRRRNTEFCDPLSLVIVEVFGSLAVDCIVLAEMDIVDSGIAHSIEVVDFGTVGFEVVHTVDSEAVDKSTVHTAAETKHPAQPVHALNFSVLLFSADDP
ncbi:hypothetical protein HG531_007008 [Fusarium graminearum]|nr:hypothetical protein HG531_007008 [Fusarium graminearum]